MKIWIITFLIFSGVLTVAAEKSSSKNQLNFEDDVIEGERARADVFVELSSEDIGEAELLYIRKDFLDYYNIESKTKPRFVE